MKDVSSGRMIIALRGCNSCPVILSVLKSFLAFPLEKRDEMYLPTSCEIVNAYVVF